MTDINNTVWSCDEKKKPTEGGQKGLVLSSYIHGAFSMKKERLYTILNSLALFKRIILFKYWPALPKDLVHGTKVCSPVCTI